MRLDWLLRPRSPSPGSDAVSAARALRRLFDAGSVPDFEKVLEQAYRRFLKPGDTVFDIGAHNGRHLAKYLDIVGREGRILAFEPIPFFAWHLSTTYADHATVTVHELALSARPGETQFVHAFDSPEESGIRERLFNTPGTRTETIVVRMDTLDRIAKDVAAIDYVKIDVEGSELDVLRGGAATLSRSRPILSIEYGRPSYAAYGHTEMTLFEWARRERYVLADLFGNPVATADQWMSVCDYAYWDYFAVPAEKLRPWMALMHREDGPA